MNDKNYIIAIDSGTQSVRAILFDHEGKEVASVQAPHEPYFSLNPGWAEQHTEDSGRNCAIAPGGSWQR